MNGFILTLLALLSQTAVLISVAGVTLAVTALSLYNSKKFRRKLMKNTKKQIEKLNKKIAQLQESDVADKETKIDKLVSKRDKAVVSLEKQTNSYYKVLSNRGLAKIDNFLKADKFLNDKTILTTKEGINITFDKIRKDAYLAAQERSNAKKAKVEAKKGKKGKKGKASKKSKTTSELVTPTPAYTLLSDKVVSETPTVPTLGRSAEIIYKAPISTDEEELN